jgi:plasmid stability protein
MGNLTIRNLDDELLEQLKEQAKANERSMEGEVRVLLQAGIKNAAGEKPARRERKIMTAADWAVQAAKVRAYMGGQQTPATAVDDIRASRDAEI